MPDEFHGFSDNSLHRVITVMVAIRAREDDDSELHRCSHTMRNSSMTGFVRTSFASFCTTSRPLSAETPSAMFTSKYLPCRTSATSGSPMDSDRKSTRLNSSHSQISYAVFCLKKKKKTIKQRKKTCLYSTLGGIVVLSFANCFISCGLAVVCFRCVAHG